MIQSHMRLTLTAMLGAIVGLAPVGELQACWLTRAMAPASEAPVYAAAPPVATQVNYVPQTAYRTEYRPVAVTSYRPITSSDPCTGCPVTSLAPVTNYVQRPVVVPYTTYRPVITNVLMPVAPACPCSSCGCPTGACGVSQAAYYAPMPVAGPAPSCGCSAGGAVAPSLPPTTSYYSPMTSYYPPQPLRSAAAPTTAYYPPAPNGYYPPVASMMTSPMSTTSANPVVAGYSPSSMPMPVTMTMPSANPSTTYYNPSEVGTSSTQIIGPTTITYPATATPGPAPMVAPPQATFSKIAPTEKPSLPADTIESQKPIDGGVPTVPPKPIPDTGDPLKSNSSGMPRLLEPSGRTAAMPIMRSGSYTPVNWSHATGAAAIETTAAKRSTQPIVDDDGWRAAK